MIMYGSSETYSTLDGALGDIAKRSFYESARVTRTNTGYRVSDWAPDVDEYVPWSYETGAVVTGALDYSRTHEPNEFYATAGHIRYNLPGAIEAIEAGISVGFTYVIAEAECQCEGEIVALEGCGEDHTAGWLLIATVVH